ncbi:MAG: hypothetical protein E7603_06530 [Ruminococcaceae bacterium]|nr:hypothetical protein [Oscillospiraceae bacterium]
MLTSLDWLIIVFMGLAAATLLSVCLMFLLRNKIGKHICFYVVAALTLFVSYIALYIGLSGWFPGQIFFGALTALASVGAIVLNLISKNNEKGQRIARILATAALIVGFINALLI